MKRNGIVFILILFLGHPLFTLGAASKEGKSLEHLVAQVKRMNARGQSRGEIAAFVTREVDQRIVSLNRSSADEQGGIPTAVHTMKKGVFDAWSRTGIGVDEPWSSAHWTWINRVGHCQENAHMAYHVLMMALGSGSEIRELACGDHIFVVWGVPPDAPGQVSITDLNRWPDTWIIDPWQGLCKPGRDVGRMDWHMTKGGLKSMELVASWTHGVYSRKYDRWKQAVNQLCGDWGREGDQLVVTAVSGNARVRVGQVMSVRPPGIFKVSRTPSGTLRLDFRAASIEGAAAGNTARLTRKLRGTLVSAGLTWVKVKGRGECLQVTLVSSGSGMSMTREGLLTRNR